MAVFGMLVGAVVGLTLLGGGRFTLGTSPSGPYFNVGFTGPQNR